MQFTARESLDNGQSWQSHVLLSEQSGSGYSAMAVLDEDGDTVGVLWESSASGLISWSRLSVSAAAAVAGRGGGPA